MKKVILKLILCTICCILLVAGLFAWSQKDAIRDHGFERTLVNNKISYINTVPLKQEAYYFAGHDKDSIYMGNYKNPTKLLKIVLPQMDTTYIDILLAPEDSIQPYKTYTVNVQPPYFYFMEGTTPILKRGKLNHWEPKRFMYDNTYFIAALPIGEKRAALKSVSRKTQEYALGLEKNTDPKIELKYDILEKQIDGIFCTDGQMLFSEALSKLIYIYYYRNQFMVMNQDVELLYRGTTIDTISKVKIKTATNQEGNVRKLASPQFLVNKRTAIHNQYIYIYATGMAKNDELNDFKNSSTIDVYDLQKKGTYSYSFRVPDFKHSKISDFLVIKNYVLTYQGNHVIVYRIHADAIAAL
ncbi:hypothetical protein [Sinomicrobium oceani]|uniref:hypothetical protein n=1 Tax=Sinomicrobium oceani TaxID=1150368 RepID=UPI00227A04D4|nr:hypothetical protein [Sinomicrobium oceani]